MEKPQVFLSHAAKDRKQVDMLVEHLHKVGFDVWYDKYLSPNVNWADQIYPAIEQAQVVLIYLKGHAVKRQLVTDEVRYAIDSATDRDKKLIFLVTDHSLVEGDGAVSRKLRPFQSIILEDEGESEASCKKAAEEILDMVMSAKSKELLLEKITELDRIGYAPGVVKNVAALADLLMKELDWARDERELHRVFMELHRFLVLMDKQYLASNDAAVYTRLNASAAIAQHLQDAAPGTKDLFLLAVKMDAYHRDMWTQITDLPEVFHFLDNDYHETMRWMYGQGFPPEQRAIATTFREQLAAEPITKDDPGRYTPEEAMVILDVKSQLLPYIFDRSDPIAPAPVPAPSKPEPPAPVTKEQAALSEIAAHMRETNALFSKIDDPAIALDFKRCLRTSYERLKRYCEVVGCLEICGECVERIAELGQEIEHTSTESTAASTAEDGIKALLGIGRAGVDDYDVFLSYKHEDGDIAQQMYHFLKSELKSVFFDKASLPELSRSDYEDAIMDSLDHAKHFVVILSDLAYLESHWVTLEMDTFHHEIVEGRKPNANLLFVVTDSVYQAIMGSNKTVLPLKYRRYEIMRVGEYRGIITRYLT